LILAFVVFNPGDLYYLGYKKIIIIIIIIIIVAHTIGVSKHRKSMT